MLRLELIARYVLLLVMLYSGVASAGVVKETVIFLQQNGRDYLSYSTVRSDWPSYDLYLQKSYSLDNFLYIYPNDFNWDEQSSGDANILRFRQSDYALLQPGRWEEEVTLTQDGGFSFKSSRAEARADGHLGFWTRPGNFEQFVYVWVLPENLEATAYRANVPGEWVARNNTLAFYARQVNDLLFEITYRPRSQALYQQLAEVMQGMDDIQIELKDNGVRLVLGEGLLFPSGGSVLSRSGGEVMERISAALTRYPDIELIVSGHTDNLPLKDSLQQRYHSNWGLASARALAVVQQLIDGGLTGRRITAQAFGPYRPVADNSSAAGRAKNRRIELELVAPSR